MAMRGLIEISKKNPSLLEAAYGPVQCIIVSSLLSYIQQCSDRNRHPYLVYIYYLLTDGPINFCLPGLSNCEGEMW